MFQRRRGISIKRRLDQIFSEIQLFLWEIGTGCGSSEVFERIKEKKTHRKNQRQKLEKIDNTQRRTRARRTRSINKYLAYAAYFMLGGFVMLRYITLPCCVVLCYKLKPCFSVA